MDETSQKIFMKNELRKNFYKMLMWQLEVPYKVRIKDKDYNEIVRKAVNLAKKIEESKYKLDKYNNY